MNFYIFNNRNVPGYIDPYYVIYNKVTDQINLRPGKYNIIYNKPLKICYINQIMYGSSTLENVKKISLAGSNTIVYKAGKHTV